MPQGARDHPGDDHDTLVVVIGEPGPVGEQMLVMADHRTEDDVVRVVVRAEGERMPRRTPG